MDKNSDAQRDIPPSSSEFSAEHPPPSPHSDSHTTSLIPDHHACCFVARRIHFSYRYCCWSCPRYRCSQPRGTKQRWLQRLRERRSFVPLRLPNWFFAPHCPEWHSVSLLGFSQHSRLPNKCSCNLCDRQFFASFGHPLWEPRPQCHPL